MRASRQSTAPSLVELATTWVHCSLSSCIQLSCISIRDVSACADLVNTVKEGMHQSSLLAM